MDWKKILGENITVVEIGCADGKDTLSFLKTFKDIKMFCFEPEARGIVKFRKKVRDSRCILYEKAVGNIDGFSDFYVCSGTPNKNYPDWHLSSSIKKPKGHLKIHPWCHFDEIIKVPIIKLDTWFNEQTDIDLIDLIWADVQGAEKDLILGGEKTLSKTKFFYTEYSKNEEYEGALQASQISDMLPNFSVVEIFEYDILLRNNDI